MPPPVAPVFAGSTRSTVLSAPRWRRCRYPATSRSSRRWPGLDVLGRYNRRQDARPRTSPHAARPTLRPYRRLRRRDRQALRRDDPRARRRAERRRRNSTTQDMKLVTGSLRQDRAHLQHHAERHHGRGPAPTCPDFRRRGQIGIALADRALARAVETRSPSRCAAPVTTMPRRFRCPRAALSGVELDSGQALERTGAHPRGPAQGRPADLAAESRLAGVRSGAGRRSRPISIATPRLNNLHRRARRPGRRLTVGRAGSGPSARRPTCAHRAGPMRTAGDFPDERSARRRGLRQRFHGG